VKRVESLFPFFLFSLEKLKERMGLFSLNGEEGLFFFFLFPPFPIFAIDGGVVAPLTSPSHIVEVLI